MLSKYSTLIFSKIRSSQLSSVGYRLPRIETERYFPSFSISQAVTLLNKSVSLSFSKYLWCLYGYFKWLSFRRCSGTVMEVPIVLVRMCYKLHQNLIDITYHYFLDLVVSLFFSQECVYQSIQSAREHGGEIQGLIKRMGYPAKSLLLWCPSNFYILFLAVLGCSWKETTVKPHPILGVVFMKYSLESILSILYLNSQMREPPTILGLLNKTSRQLQTIS